MSYSLEELRRGIREVDYQILKLVKKRLQLAKKAGVVKRRAGLPIVDSNVERGVIERALTWSNELGLDREFTVKLIGLLIAEAVQVQENHSEAEGRHL